MMAARGSAGFAVHSGSRAASVAAIFPCATRMPTSEAEIVLAIEAEYCGVMAVKPRAWAERMSWPLWMMTIERVTGSRAALLTGTGLNASAMAASSAAASGIAASAARASPAGQERGSGATFSGWPGPSPGRPTAQPRPGVWPAVMKGRRQRPPEISPARVSMMAST